MKHIEKIEIHYTENKNHTVNIEYRVFVDAFTYDAKTKSRLTKAEKAFIETNGAKEIFYF